eukprot:scaffold1928_cov381-Prasinococcus_capsulatus_cf.AAC.11
MATAAKLISVDMWPMEWNAPGIASVRNSLAVRRRPKDCLRRPTAHITRQYTKPQATCMVDRNSGCWK